MTKRTQSGSKRGRKTRSNATARGKSGHDPIQIISLDEIRPSPENNTLYRPVDPDDPEIIALTESIEKHGIQEPLVVTRDGWIVSGHRRHAAATLANLAEVPCKVLDFDKEDDHDRFMQLLRECNRQRTKSFDEKLREEVVSADPEEAYVALVSHRMARSEESIGVEGIALRGEKRRSRISAAKRPFLDAVWEVLEERQDFWPLSDRQIHYGLLNNPPLIHASKPNSRYANTKQSYKALTDLLTRARLEELIPMAAIADPTRPVTVWKVDPDPQVFIQRELDHLLKGYWRNLMQSQPNYLEIVGEKNTVESTVRPIAMQYCIPYTIGRGFCSLPPRAAIADRFAKSGKETLVLLILSDFDPDGEEIAHSLARSLRDDFGIYGIEAIKVALTADHVERFNLPPQMQAKAGSTNYRRFTEEHGHDVFELEALPPKTLQELLTEAIESVIDVEAFNHEIDQEKKDAASLDVTRRRIHRLFTDSPTSGA